jgi:hypothetical protein
MRTAVRLIIAVSAIAIAQGTLRACPVCYGASDSPLTAGMDTAILVMLGITGFVLTAIVSCFFLLWRRAKRHQAALSESLSINEYGHLEVTNDPEEIPSGKRSY